jgi:hypothetical protein
MIEYVLITESKESTEKRERSELWCVLNEWKAKLDEEVV